MSDSTLTPAPEQDIGVNSVMPDLPVDTFEVPAFLSDDIRSLLRQDPDDDRAEEVPQEWTAEERLDHLLTRLAFYQDQVSTEGNTPINRNAVTAFEMKVAQTRVVLARQAGDSAEADRLTAVAGRLREKLITDNVALAYQVASVFKRPGVGVDFDDLNQAVLTELVAQIDAWDPDRGSLSHYLKQYVAKAARQQVRFDERPHQTYGQYTENPKVTDAVDALRAELGRTPSHAEVADRTGLSINVVIGARTPTARRLDAPATGDSDTTSSTLMELVAGQLGGQESGRDLSDAEYLGWLTDVVSRLSPHQRLLVIKRGGLDGSDALPIAASSALLGMGREKGRETLDQADLVLGPDKDRLLQRF